MRDTDATCGRLGNGRASDPQDWREGLTRLAVARYGEGFLGAGQAPRRRHPRARMQDPEGSNVGSGAAGVAPGGTPRSKPGAQSAAATQPTGIFFCAACLQDGRDVSCGFWSNFGDVAEHEINDHIYFCAFGCNFQGSYKVVEQHEKTCGFAPASNPGKEELLKTQTSLESFATKFAVLKSSYSATRDSKKRKLVTESYCTSLGEAQAKLIRCAKNLTEFETADGTKAASLLENTDNLLDEILSAA